MRQFDHLDPARYALPAELRERTLSPALVVHLDLVDHNLAQVIEHLGGDPGRWRPHVKTTKIPAVFARVARAGVRHFKCATPREMRVLLETLETEKVAGDVLLAHPLQGPALQVVGDLARRHPSARLSVLVEDAAVVEHVPPEVSIFLDLNPGMDRTGIPLDDLAGITRCAHAVGERLRGLHFYDGHLHQPFDQRRLDAFRLYERLLELRADLMRAGLRVEELISSGTPSLPCAAAFPGFREMEDGVHRVSPGTVVFHDLRSQELIPELGLVPAAVVFSRVVSHPRPGRITADAGSKSIAAEAGDPCAEALGHPELIARSPSEEHLPFDVVDAPRPERGTPLMLVPRHICPTVNLAEEALLMEGGRLVDKVPVAARAHDLLI